MGVSKVELSNGETLLDLTEDTVTAETLGEGATAHNSKGEEIVGTMKSGDMLKSVYDTDDDGKVDMANNSEKLGGSPLKEVLAIAYINSLITSGVLADATCNDDGVIIPKSEQLVTIENGILVFKTVDYYPMEILEFLINAGKNAVITLNIGKAFVFEEGKQLKLPIKYDDGTIVETVIRGPLRAFPSVLNGLSAYTLVLGLRGAELNAEGKFKHDSIAGWITGIRAEDSVKLDGLTRMDIVFESVASAGTLPRGICDENGVISPDEPWFEFDEESNIQRGEVTPNAYDFVWFAASTSHIILSVKADIEPVDGKLPLKIKTVFFGEELPSIIDVPANSPLKADKTYHFIVDSRYTTLNETENGYEVTGLKGAIIGLDPETDSAPTEGSTNLITSGAVYDVIGDINSILDNINGEVV